MNDRDRNGRAMAALLLGALCLALAGSCSVVFRSSIQGTVIDQEDWADGATTGVNDAKVFLYTDLATRDADYAAYADGDEATLPDASGKAEYAYFQSTVTDANGAYDFTGFIWEKFFSEYGKTADRAEVFLLVYHPDYGLWKNPTPLYVVSDVTNQLDIIKIEDLWNEGRLAGTALNWKDGKGLAGVAVNLYVAESWTYDAGGEPVNGAFPNVATTTATTDGDGRWAADVRFRKMPDRAADKGKAPVRATFVLADYRANDDSATGDAWHTSLSNGALTTSVDLDRDGVTAAQGDYEDAFVLVTAAYDAAAGAAALRTVDPITLQRWRFGATVRGRVYDTSAVGYANGVKVELGVPDLSAAGTTSSAYTEKQINGNVETDGVFDLGTIRWKLRDVAGLEATQKAGTVAVVMECDGVDPSSGDPSTLSPDATVVLELIVP